ncbi:glutathione peroxidase [Wenzhouxiangella sediminis]|uniref:Glutathione peroxidase n=2 Tax=Wenzhouxiangella sediminis TaxID=1792836 RepID=A0A3E1K679_9GAMM|nr:glutathione peroxidase [Wenzhouxiangella sediminis]
MAGTAGAECGNLLDYSHRGLATSKETNLCEAHGGQVILVVNTASQCGYTPQFEGLEALYQKYRGEGFVVLGFPSDDFRQELDDEEATADVCYVNYGVSFPMFATSSVKGESANALFRALNAATDEPGWNFTKYLVDRNGEVVERFTSSVEPMNSRLESRVAELVGR